MSKVQLTVTMDEKLVNALEKACYNSGMEIDLAFTMFAQTVRKKKCIPDEVITDPFYQPHKDMISPPHSFCNT